MVFWSSNQEKEKRDKNWSGKSECKPEHMWGKISWWHLLSLFQSLGPAPSLNFSTMWTKYLLKLVWVGSLFTNRRKKSDLHRRLKLYIVNPIPTKEAVEIIHWFIHSFIHPFRQWTSNRNLLCSTSLHRTSNAKMTWDMVPTLKEFPTLEGEMEMWREYSW